MDERERFIELVRDLPLVAVDLILVRDEQEVLLGLRANRPAQRSWFVPGGRILKGERRVDALQRVAARELGIADVAALNPGFFGPFEHFYPDCFAGDIGVSTHYVVLAHRVDVPADFEVPGGDDQHEALRWWNIGKASQDPEVHRFSRDYIGLLKEGSR